MKRAALVLRPEPGNAATAARLAANGVTVRCRPLFAVAPVAWSPPDPADHDALLLTSANAIRYAGEGLRAFAHLPVLAVGPATAAAARDAGLAVALTGSADAVALIAQAHAAGWQRPLHLAGRERQAMPDVLAVTVYASEPLTVDDAEVVRWRGHVALLHSSRAARRLAALVDRARVDRQTIGIAALSDAVAGAAGAGWAGVAIAAAPRDALLVAAAVALIDPPGTPADKRA